MSFLVNKALLVTGANADTNAMLYATMVRRQDFGPRRVESVNSGW